MYKRMIIPLDGSELAESVFPYARELAGRFGIHPIFLYVCESHESHSLPVYLGYIERVAENITTQVKVLRKEIGTLTQGPEPKAEGLVVSGHPAEEILRCAGDKKADLILMVTHGRSGIRRWAMGSVADKVLRSSAIPVLLVHAATSEARTGRKESLKTVLVPLDGSELAESVLPHIEMLAKQGDLENIKVVLIMVCEPMTISYAPTMEVPVNWGNLIQEHMEYSKKNAAHYLSKVTSYLKDKGLTVSSEVIEGHPATEIINYAAKIPDSITAMATHGRSGLGRWAFGSTAEKVLNGAHRPVLLVRPAGDGSPSLVRTFMGTVKTLPPI